MKKKSIALASFFIINSSFVIPSMAQTSPNGKIFVEPVNEGLSVKHLKGGLWQEIMLISAKDLKETKTKKTKKVSYDMLLGKKSHCTNSYNEAIYSRKDGQPITMRVYNDGVAWNGGHGYVINTSSCTNNWLMKWSDAYEGFYPKNREQVNDERYGYPALFEYNDGVFALLSESCMKSDNAGTSMYSLGNGNYRLMPDGQEDGGWQTAIIGNLPTLVESTLITDNSEPEKTDLFALPKEKGKSEAKTWIEPGVCSWIYWAYNHGSNDISIIRKYIDMAVKMKLPYVLIDAEWDEMDKIASNNGKTIEDAVKECVDNGVKPIIWYNSSIGWLDGAPGPKFRLNKPEDREKEFAWCEKIGVKGVKVDFFNGDTNDNFKLMIELLESAAKHHLLVNFHGATIPRGWQRTYPNLVSTEAVYGAEWYNNKPILTNKAAEHNTTIPFTRNVIGSMDYTPCAFSDSQHPHITTHAHELALTVLYESGIQHLADRPESLLAQPEEVRNFLTNLPTAWDETRLLGGYPGENIIMARRKGDTWYVAGINGWDNPQNLTVNLSRLRDLGNNITTFQDSGIALADAIANPAKAWKITHDTNITTCQPRGGFVMVITK